MKTEAEPRLLPPSLIVVGADEGGRTSLGDPSRLPVVLTKLVLAVCDGKEVKLQPFGRFSALAAEMYRSCAWASEHVGSPAQHRASAIF